MGAELPDPIIATQQSPPCAWPSILGGWARKAASAGAVRTTVSRRVQPSLL